MTPVIVPPARNGICLLMAATVPLSTSINVQHVLIIRSGTN
jgi:hypothetical protein